MCRIARLLVVRGIRQRLQYAASYHRQVDRSQVQILNRRCALIFLRVLVSQSACVALVIY